jgi:hemerythrin superfamily protein
MKATLLLRKDHERVQQLFEKYRNAKGPAQRAVFEEIRREVLIHSAIETEFFYPELRNSVSDRGEELTAVALEDHQTVEHMLGELAAMNADKSFDTKMNELMDAITRHIELEEEDLFAEARKVFSEHKLEELGLEMEARKSILTQIAA